MLSVSGRKGGHNSKTDRNTYPFIGEWTSTKTPDEVLQVLEKASVPAGKIYSAKDIVEDEHINARGMIEKVTVGTKEEGRGWELKVKRAPYLLLSCSSEK